MTDERTWPGLTSSRAVARGWSGAGFASRASLLILTGVAWSVSSLHQAIAHPDYWDPVTTSDYFAVYAYTSAWLLAAVALLILREVTPGDVLRSRTILVVAVGCLLAGLANALEDGLGLSALGTAYVLGAVIGGFGLLFVAAFLWSSPERSLTWVPGLAFVSMAAVTTGGGVLALVAWGGFALVLARRRSSP